MSRARPRSGNKIPCESAECDTTTHHINSELSNSGLISYTHISAPVEHSELNDEKSDVSSLPDSLNNPSLDSPNKGVDTTFQPNLDTTTPPPYSIGENMGANYIPNTPTALDIALSKLSQVRHFPASILGHNTLRNLSLHLDPDMMPAENWMMMAEYMLFSNLEIRHFASQQFKTKAVIEHWSATISREGHRRTIGDLLDIFHDMNRMDVITDIPDFILRDAERHVRCLERSVSTGSSGRLAAYNHTIAYPESQAPSFHKSPSNNTLVTSYEFSGPGESQLETLPVQVPKVTPSGPGKMYDAFVLCNIADKEFVVNKFLPKVEDDANLKLCFAERDIPPGNLKFSDQMDYMFSRSRKLVVILSDEFFKSREHEWQSNLAISQDPASRNARIIPVKYEKMQANNIFDYLGCCDLTKTMKEEWFWNKIINGIKS